MDILFLDSSDLEGSPGMVIDNLYFVAKDKAQEDWQQKIIAYHESFCLKIGHKEAKVKELQLAEHLGKQKEYRIWREQIDNGF